MFSELIYRMKFNSVPFYINNFVSYIYNILYYIYIQHLQIHTWNNALPVPSTEAKQRFLVSYPNWTEQGRGDAVDGLELRLTSWYGKYNTIIHKVLYIQTVVVGISSINSMFLRPAKLREKLYPFPAKDSIAGYSHHTRNARRSASYSWERTTFFSGTYSKYDNHKAREVLPFHHKAFRPGSHGSSNGVPHHSLIWKILKCHESVWKWLFQWLFRQAALEQVVVSDCWVPESQRTQNKRVHPPEV